MSIEIVRLKSHQITETDIDKIGQIAAEAFEEDPFICYAYPKDLYQRKDGITELMKAMLRIAAQKGEIYLAEDTKGIAAILPPGKYPISWKDILSSGILSVGFKSGFKASFHILPRLLEFMLKTEITHKRYVAEPHIYLGILAIPPQYQRKGYGSALLQHLIAVYGKDYPIYLETTTDNNLPFYQKHGFKDLGKQVFSDGKTCFWPMKRKPD